MTTGWHAACERDTASVVYLEGWHGKGRGIADGRYRYDDQEASGETSNCVRPGTRCGPWQIDVPSCRIEKIVTWTRHVRTAQINRPRQANIRRPGGFVRKSRQSRAGLAPARIRGAVAGPDQAGLRRYDTAAVPVRCRTVPLLRHPDRLPGRPERHRDHAHQQRQPDAGA